MNVEFLDESLPDDVAVTGDGAVRRGPSWIAGALVAAVLTLGAFVIVHRHSPPPPTVATPTPHLVLAPLPKELAGRDETFSAVYQRATDPEPAVDILRNGSNATSCRSVRIGTAPQRVAGTALTMVLRGYRLLDSARIIDQNAGLCALQVRARDRAGTVALIIVSSPSAGSVSMLRNQNLQTATTSVGTTAIEFARFVTHDGWTIVAGTTGPLGKQPTGVALEELATNTSLRW